MQKFLAGLFLMCLSVSTAAVAAPDRWVQARSDHFIVLTDGSDKDARRLDGQFERMRALFQKVLPHASSDSGVVITVVALRDKKDFQALEPTAYLVRNQLQIDGIFLESSQGNFIMLHLDSIDDPDDDHPYTTIYHEYTHFTLRSARDWLPLWLNEGLAEFYQNSDIYGSSVSLGRPSPDDILFLRDHSLIPITTLLSVDENSPYYHDEQKGSIFYSESWALVHYLEMKDFDHKTHSLQDYAGYLQRREDPITAAQHAFGDLTHLQQDLQNYINQSTFKLFHLNTGITIDESKFKVAPVSQTDVDAVRAEILICSRRTPDAETLLNAARAADPKNPAVPEAMGFAKFSENDFAAAAREYGLAVQLGSQDYLASYFFAEMSLHSGAGSPDQIESSLRNAIKLNPDYAPPYDALARFYIGRHEKLDEAHMLSVTAVSLDPDNFQYRMNAAEAFAASSQFANAINVLNALLKMPITPRQTGLVKSRLDAIQQFQARNQDQNQPGQQTSTADMSSQSATGPGIAPPSGPNTTVVSSETPDGKKSLAIQPKLQYPAHATGPHRNIRGVLSEVHCALPAVLTLTIVANPPAAAAKTSAAKPAPAPKTITLYTNDYFKVDLSAGNFMPSSSMNMCVDIQGMKALVEYNELADAIPAADGDPAITGQIRSIMLFK